MNSSDSISILWVIPKWTLPANDGARVATERLIVNTINAGARVDVLCLANQNEDIDPKQMLQKWNVQSVRVIRRSLPETKIKKIFYYLKSFLLNPFTPLTFSSFAKPEIQNLIKSEYQNSNYDCLMLDGLHLALPFINKGNVEFPENFGKVIYRAHNIEQDLWKKAALESKNPVMKMFLKFQSKLVEKFEENIIKSVDGIAPIALEDLNVIKTIDSSANQNFTPLGLNFYNPLDQITDEKVKFLFLGRLDWPPNRDGLEWILKEVWPEVILKRPEAMLNIVGSGDKSWIEKYRSLEGIQILGRVDDIRDAYKDCHFTLAPIFYGSGTRIKVLESYSMGRCLISTSMGVQGASLDSGDFVCANTKNEWIETLSNINLLDSHISALKIAQAKLAKSFDEVDVGENFYNWAKTLV